MQHTNPATKENKAQPAKRRRGRPPKTVEAELERLRLYDEILRLRAGGYTFHQVGQHLGISRQAATENYKRALAYANEEIHELAKFALVDIRRREEVVVSAAYELITTPCRRCETYTNEDAKRTCSHCRGSGYQYGPTNRVMAMTAIQRSNEHLARVHRLHTHQVEVTINRDMLEEVETLSDEQLLTRVKQLDKALLALPEKAGE